MLSTEKLLDTTKSDQVFIEASRAGKILALTKFYSPILKLIGEIKIDIITIFGMVNATIVLKKHKKELLFIIKV